MVENEDQVDKQNEKKYYTSVFNKFDKDKSGAVELAELVNTLENDNEVPKELSEKVFNAADKNKDTKLDFDEFHDMINDKKYKDIFLNYVSLYVRYVVPRKQHHIVEPDGLYEEKYSCWPPPIALIFISALELTFFIINEQSDDPSVNGARSISKFCIYDPYRRHQVWRFFTYMFVHIGYTHLAVNLVVQLFLGFPLEMVHKGWRVLLVYFSGVVAGSLGTSITDPKTYLAGASGGVYALITGHIGTICMNWNEMDFPCVQLGLFLVITSVDVGTSIYNRYILELQENIGYAAHICGAIAGLLVGVWILKNFVPSKRDTCMWWCALTLYLIFMGTMILLNIFWSDHFLPSST